MRKKFQIVLTLSLVVIFQIGFWSFTFLSKKSINTELVKQVKEDNQVIGLQLITLLKQTGLTDKNPDTDSVLQHICDVIKLPNGGFICAINKAGNLVAAPGLMPGMTMKFTPKLQDLSRKTTEILPVNLGSDSVFQGYAYFADEKRLDVVASLPIGDDLRLFVHQNSALINQKAWNSVKPLTFIGLIVTIIAGAFTYFTTNRIILKYESKIEVQNKDLKTAFKEISEKQTEILAQNEALEHQRNELEKKNHIINEQNKEITDSINYAQRIQKATLPKDAIDENIARENFILFIPRDIVSGDFYWYHNFDDALVITAADCTGHGVPGAFMSMIGISFLNEIVIDEENRNPAEILDQLRKRVIQALGQEYGRNSANDGINMALCIIEKDSLKMTFAGAYNPVAVVHNNEMLLIKGDKMPVGIHGKMDEDFSLHQTQLFEGDIVYLFSDGFPDQFGGSQGRKFMTKNFLSLLNEIKAFPLNDQKEVLHHTIMEWKGDIPQVDDILVIGLKINK